MTKVTCIAALRAAMGSSLTRHGEKTRLRRELEESSDRALAEMGLCRGDVASVAGGCHGR